MSKLTITEALQEIKTINSRLVKKRETVLKYIVRDSRVRDPFEDKGGSNAYIKQERQSIGDLEARIIAIRTLIQQANLTNILAIEGVEKSVAEWLTWRREVAAGQKQFLQQIFSTIQQTRTALQQKGGKIVAMASAQVSFDKDAPIEALVAVDEQETIQMIEGMENVLGILDGRLSLFNATTTIDV